MKITEISIKRPVAITMVAMLFLLLGIIGRMYIGADLFPKVNTPVVFISTFYPGAGAEEIEKEVVKHIEDAVSSISGVDEVHSTASEGYASTVIIFKMSANTDAAVMDTQKAVDSIAGKLPKDATRPTLYKYDQNAQPILVLTLSGEKRFEELHHEAESIKERLERILGVGSVSIFGSREKELMVEIDRTKLEYFGIGINQVISRLQLENLNIPGGTINQSAQNKIVRVEGEFANINEVKALRIPCPSGGLVQLDEIAEVTLKYPEIESMSRANGKEAIGLMVQKQSDANIVETGERVKNDIEELRKSLNGMELEIVQDSTLFITSSLNGTQLNLIEGICTTAIVLFFFLRQWSSLLMVMIAIPTSLISTFFMMYMFGFTFNILSLMGLALCVGILVDDAVVILENIHRHLRMGKDPKTAALDGRSEIGMAAIAITLCDIVVFAPIAFMSGMVGQYFKQFGLTVVVATLFSLLVSFTLTPMMASRLFKKGGETNKKKGRITSYTDKIGGKILKLYQTSLQWALQNRFKVLFTVISLVICSVLLIPLGVIGTDFMPQVDSGELEITINLTPGSTIEKTDQKVQQVEEYLGTIPELDYYYARIGVDNLTNKGYIYAKLVDKRKRERSLKQVVASIREWGKRNLSGVEFNVTAMGMIDTGEGSKPIVVNVKGDKTEVIREIAGKAEEIVKNTPGTVDVSNSLESGQPEFNIKVDRVAAADNSVSVYDISNVVRASIEGSKAGVYRTIGDEYDIRVKLQDEQVVDSNDIGELQIVNQLGQMIPLSRLGEITLTESQTMIQRLDKQRVGKITANLQEGYTLGNVTEGISRELNKISLQEGYSISFGGEQTNMDDAFKSLIQALILSVILVYMVLTVLYESFLTPFVRILALPVGVIGALGMLALTGKSLNMLSMIGLIMLDGLAAKNGTLLIDYTNTLMRTKGLSLKDALYEAGSTRLRPIMMTSFAMIVGMLPAALSLGDGSEYKSGMAVVIIGGMLTSTLLSPIVLPVAYTLIDDFQNWLKSKWKKIFARNYKLQYAAGHGEGK